VHGLAFVHLKLLFVLDERGETRFEGAKSAGEREEASGKGREEAS